MGNTTNELNWAARERLRSVELRLWWRGFVGRKELMEVFGISAAQATSDLQKYFELNEGACFYQTNRKRYEAVATMTCVLHEPVLEEGLQVVFGEMVGDRWQRERVWTGKEASRLASVRLPVREGSPEVERAMAMAAGSGRRIRVKYASVNSGRSSWRELAPSSFGWDGRRWHVRAWCFENGEFRDFVLSRMEEAEWRGAEFEAPRDEAWESWAVVTLRLNPELTEARRRALRLDYGLDGDLLEIRVREAMKPYLLAEMFLMDEKGGGLPGHFVLVAG